MSVLIIEDSPVAVEQIRGMLRSLGFQGPIGAVQTPEEARAVLQASTPDVIFLDIMLEHGNLGLDVVWDIRRLAPSARIIVITGLPRDHPSVATMRALQPHALLEKPLRTEDVARALQA